MILYNVTIKLEWDIHADWMLWMKEVHMPEVMATACFSKCQLLRLIEVDEEDGPTYAAQYYADNKDAYNEYIQQHATTLRQKGLDRWGNRFIAFRSVMQVVHE